MRLPRPLALTAALAVLVSACADRREALVQSAMEQRVAEESGGALQLASFAKTNGYEQELGGIRLYILEWETRLLVQADVWKQRNALVGYWQDFAVMDELAGMWSSMQNSSSARRFFKGATVILTGSTQLQKTERGWRVVGSEVATSQTLNNEPREPDLADVQAQLWAQLPVDAFIGRWTTVAGQDPLEARSSLTVTYANGTFSGVYTNGTGVGSVTLPLRRTGTSSLVGDYDGAKQNFTADLTANGHLILTIDPFAEFAPLRGLRFERVSR